MRMMGTHDAASQLFDSHVHVGHFRDDLYFSPERVVAEMNALAVARFAVSSTSASVHPFETCRTEIERVLELSDGRAIPLLWITPDMLRISRDLSAFFVLPFKGLKIHGLNGWEPEGRELRQVFAVAAERRLPVLLHTGMHPCCEAGCYAPLCEEFPSVSVILAHGRPLGAAMEIVRKFPNTFVDTAFMPSRDIAILWGAGMGEKILFGTDFPINTAFYRSSPRAWYRRQARRVLGLDGFAEASNSNFARIYGAEA